jgi:triacylglycerol lipase
VAARRVPFMRLAGLSPRRRALAAAIALLAAAAIGGTAVAVTRSSSGQAGRPAPGRLGPVLLVPGYGAGTSALSVLAAAIRAAGRTATIVRLPGNGTGSLVTDAAALNAAVGRALADGAPSVDVIGYSAGGVVALIWARTDDGAARARRVITLGSPFHGTRLAAGAAGFVPGACPAACQQLVPGSALLARLDVASPAGLPPWLSLWTTDDQTVTPPDSARLAGAISLAVQSLCPAVRISHSQLPASPVVTAIVLQALGPGPLRPPSRAACVSS